jgi:uncharacterized membrane protein
MIYLFTRYPQLKSAVISYLAFLVSMVALDLIWLFIVARDLYISEMGVLIANQSVLSAGIAFYLLFPLGATIFVGISSLKMQSWLNALIYGLLFGFFSYMTYDLTCLAIIEQFPKKLAFIDIAWGSLLCAVCSVTSYLITTQICKLKTL